MAILLFLTSLYIIHCRRSLSIIALNVVKPFTPPPSLPLCIMVLTFDFGDKTLTCLINQVVLFVLQYFKCDILDVPRIVTLDVLGSKRV